jgi:PAS domain S-box-containing protein
VRFALLAGVSIRGRLLLLAAVMFVPFLLVVGFGTWLGWQGAVDNALEQQRSRAHQVAVQLEGQVERLRALLAGAEAAVRDDLAGSARNDERLRHLWAEASSTITTLAVVAPDGRMLASANLTPKERAGLNFSRAEAFSSALETRAFSIGPPRRSAVSGEWIVAIARPILDRDGRVQAIVAATTQLDIFDATLESMRSSRDETLTLTTEKGVLLAQVPRRVAQRGRDLSGRAHFRVARGGGTFKGATEMEDGTRFYGASVPVRNAPWQVFAGVPAEVAHAPAQAQLREYVLLAFLMGLVAVGAAFRLARGLTLPIRQLQRGVNTLAGGALGHRVEVHGASELAELAADINRMAARLSEAEGRLKLVVDAVPAMLAYTNRERRFVFVNSRYEQLTGRAPADTVGYTVREVLGDGVYAAIEPYVDRAMRGETVEFSRTQHRPGGSTRELRIQYVPDVDARGEAHGIIGMVTDVTELAAARNALQVERDLLERRVGERTAELEALVHELQAFSYSVAHDLRSPLGVISGFAHMVAKDEAAISAEGKRKLGVVEQNIAHLVELVDDLLTLAQVNRAEIARAPLDMRALALAELEALRTRYPGAEVHIAEMPPAEGDATLLRQAFGNLLDNALKYSSRGQAPRVEAGWSEPAQAYYVRDNGVGFDMNHAARMFGPFERLHDAGQFAGTGIGLAIVKRVIERHDGRVWASSEPGKGATFYFQIGRVLRRGALTSGTTAR